MTYPSKPKKALVKQWRSTDENSRPTADVLFPEDSETSIENQGPQWFSELHTRRISELFQAFRAQTFPLRYQPAFATSALLTDVEVGQHSDLAQIQSRSVCEPDSTSRPGTRYWPEQEEEHARPRGSRSTSRSSTSNIFTVQDARPKKHKSRVAELARFLEPLLPPAGSLYDAFILICWGNSDSCYIRNVPLTEPTDETIIWRDIRLAWMSYRYPWLKWLSYFLRVTSVETVTLSIAGKAPDRWQLQDIYHFQKRRSSATQYIGTFSRDDLAAKTNHLQDVIASYVPQEWPCCYDSTLGMTNCNADCVRNSGLSVPCPEQEVYDAERELRRLKMRDLKRLAFSNSSIAKVNTLLKDEDIIYSHRKFLQIVNEWHCPSLGEIPFRAICIDETLLLGSFPPAIFTATTMLLCLVLACRLVYNDWTIAWSVGCFFATIVATLLTS